MEKTSLGDIINLSSDEATMSPDDTQPGSGIIYLLYSLVHNQQSAPRGVCGVKKKNWETSFGPEGGDLNHSGDNMIMANGFTRKLFPLTNSLSFHQRE